MFPKRKRVFVFPNVDNASVAREEKQMYVSKGHVKWSRGTTFSSMEEMRSGQRCRNAGDRVSWACGTYRSVWCIYIYIYAYSIFNHLLLLLFVFRKRTLWLVLLVLLVPFLKISISVDIPSRQGSLVSVIAWFEGEQKRKIIWQRQVEEGGPRESRTVSGSYSSYTVAAAWWLGFIWPWW